MVELVGPLSNPAVKAAWEELAARLTEVRASGAPIRRAKLIRKVRPRGQVLKIICTLLERVNGPMRAKEIHRAVEAELGETVPWSSIANCLRKNIIGKDALVGKGRYQMKCEEPQR